MKGITTALVSLLALGGAQAMASEPVTPDEVEAELRRLAEDYERDPMIIDTTFGIEVDGVAWTVDSTPPAEGKPARVTVTRGEPAVATWVDTMSGEVFRRIAEGEITAYTAAARARESDVALINHRTTAGMPPPEEFPASQFRSVFAHFWTTGQPEVIRYGFESSKEAHGAQVSILMYSDQLRSGWWGLLPGQHANADPRDQTNPFPSMIVVHEAGTGRARIGGKEFPLSDRTMILVPPGVAHELWNPGDRPAEGFLIMYGTGA